MARFSALSVTIFSLFLSFRLLLNSLPSHWPLRTLVFVFCFFDLAIVDLQGFVLVAGVPGARHGLTEEASSYVT